MMKIPEKFYNGIVLEPQQRWERAEQSDEAVARVDDEGREVIAPLFDVGVKQYELLGQKEFGDPENPTGTKYTFCYTLEDNLSRLVQAWIPHHVDAEFTSTGGMAYTTMPQGYDADRSELIAKLGIPRIQVGAEQSDQFWPGLKDLLRLGRTALESPKVSIAKSSQAEIEIIDHVIHEALKELALPENIEMDGDSRGSKTTFGRAVYGSLQHADGTPMYGVRPLWIDPKAIVVHDRLPYDDFLRVFTWLGKEALFGSKVIADLAKDNKLLSLRGTVSPNPNFVLASAIGIGPALLSGETGELVRMMPRDIRGFANGYINDELYDEEHWDNSLGQLPNVYHNKVDKAVHAHLLSLRGLQRQLGRLDGLRDESVKHGSDFERYNIHQITGRTHEQFSEQKGSFTFVAA